MSMIELYSKNYISPFVNELKQISCYFRKLSLIQRVLTVALAVLCSLATILLAGIGGYFVFYSLVKLCKSQNQVKTVPIQGSNTGSNHCTCSETRDVLKQWEFTPTEPIKIARCTEYHFKLKNNSKHGIDLLQIEDSSDLGTPSSDELQFVMSDTENDEESEEDSPKVCKEKFGWSLSCAAFLKNIKNSFCREKNNFEKLPVDSKEIKAFFQLYIKNFASGINYDENYGFIEKIDLEPETQIFVRADLHGSLITLQENLRALRKRGLLDKKFQCKPMVHLVFEGDYMDRGPHSLLLLTILIKLKQENPLQVHLIRGNHEDVSSNIMHNNLDKLYEELTSFEMDAEAFDLLTLVYQTMPVTLFIGVKNDQGKKEYVQCTHGMFEIKQDFSPLTNSNKPLDFMQVPKKQKFSKRIEEIEIRPDVDYELLLEKLKKQKADKKIIQDVKLKIAVKRLRQLAWIEEQERTPNDHLNAYMWGDVAVKKESSYLGMMGYREWKLTPDDIKHCLRVNSGLNKTKMIFRGHQHQITHHFSKGKMIATTLPVGMDSIYATLFPGQDDKCYILTTAKRVKDWTKVSMTRKPFKTHTRFSKPYPIFSDEV
jgi:hypothetical protein